jgi:hypothetical protein
MIMFERLREVLHYNPETGKFRWLVSVNSRAQAGAVAGTINAEGYRQIQIDGRLYGAHRLAWLYMAGEWPADKVDHRNVIKDDNRWENLREASHAQNCQNKRKPRDNKSGVKGVYWHARTSKWCAYIRANGRAFYLGLFTDINEAAAAYAAASEKYHGDFGRTA